MLATQKERYERVLNDAVMAVTELCPYVDRKGKLYFYPVEYIQSTKETIIYSHESGELCLFPVVPKTLFTGKVANLMEYFYTSKQNYIGVGF